jgi:hypothetical protein
MSFSRLVENFIDKKLAKSSFAEKSRLIESHHFNNVTARPKICTDPVLSGGERGNLCFLYR